MKVSLSEDFEAKMLNFPKADLLKIAEFIQHVEQFGLTDLIGRNKNSNNVPTDDPNWLKKVQYAQQHKLWHYHIGIPYYQQATNGDQVSEYILHYIRLDDEIKLVELSYHPPFTLPSLKSLI